jgi:putative IMPACT (imprinted ancient) family translation regulator
MQVISVMPQNRHCTISSSNDDGEPSNSAGMPIYGSFLSQTYPASYGVKLGVGGLIHKTHNTLEQEIIEND